MPTVRNAALGLFCSLPLLFAGCEKPAPPQVPTPTVTVAKPIVRDVTRYVLVTGRARASQVYEARARVEGFLGKAGDFQEGEDVAEDVLLFKIEPEPFEAELAAANARLAAANAQKKLADTVLRRVTAQVEKKVATQADLDRAQADVEVVEAEILRETAAVEQANIQLGYTEIYAKTSGMIGEIYVDPGNVVGGAETSLLATIQKYDPLHIYFDAPEGVLLRHLREIAERKRSSNADIKIHVQFEGESGFPHAGELVMFDNAIDPETGTVSLRGEIPNPDKRALPGAYATIRIEAIADKHSDAVLVDERAIGTDLSGKYILIVDDEKIVHRRRILLGQLHNGFRHIVAMWDESKETAPDPESEPRPIDPDFRYVLAGLQKARPGNPIEISQEAELSFSDADVAEEQDRTVDGAAKDSDSESPNS